MHLTYRWRVTLVIALGLLMVVLDVTIASSAGGARAARQSLGTGCQWERQGAEYPAV